MMTTSDPSIRFAFLLVAALAIGSTACPSSDDDPDREFRKHDLKPTANPFPEEFPALATEQPPRARPRAVAVAPDRSRWAVALQGSIDDPGDEVVTLDPETREVVDRYRVGTSPTGLAFHPDGRYLVVTNRYSNYLSIIDLEDGTVRAHPADSYAIQPAFGPDGDRLYVTNRWRDTLQTWDVSRSEPGLDLERVRPEDHPHGVPVGTNPRDLTVNDDGSRVYVAAQGELTITAVDTESMTAVDLGDTPEPIRDTPRSGNARLDVGAPPNDLVLHDGRLYVPTLSASTHHPLDRGPDTNEDGHPGDGTPNTDFNDLQNELAVYDRPALTSRIRYTSDTICCRDYRDVAPDDPELGEHLPDESTWIVEGALPEQALVAEVSGTPHLVVLYSGSNELQRFTIESNGRLQPGPIVETEFNPMGLALDRERREILVTNRLSETLTVVGLAPFEVLETTVVGDVSGGEFPATDAEIGEFYMFAGAAFSVDGDQTCVHCHRGRAAIGKTFHMPLLKDMRGTRNTMDHRGLMNTRPWFMEGAQDETNFFPVVNEFARPENFCCADYPDRNNCPTDPPEACQKRDGPRSFPTRDAFFAKRARQVLDRERSFGDALPTPIDFLGMTKLLGLHLLSEPALLPNPNPVTPRVRRGRKLFNSSETGCAGCHPPPTFAVSFTNNPADGPIRFGPVITPDRAADGTNIDLTDEGFLGTFPMAEQSNGAVRFKTTSLLGIWDRPAPFLHDGRADSLREAICTPNHPALRSGETGFNELNGMPDTHGGTSHLTPEQIDALIAYLKTL